MTRAAIPLIVILFAVLSCELPGVNPPPPPPSPSPAPTQHYTNPPQTYNYVQPLYEVVMETPYTPALIVQSRPEFVQREAIFSGEYFVYVVERGDNFHDLARRFCRDARQYRRLLAINGMIEGEVLEIGREVMI